MTAIALIDIGGSSIKFGTWDGQQLHKDTSHPTPATRDEFEALLKQQVSALQRSHTIVGVGISIPGAVNKQTGYVEGKSAIDYIHGFNMHARMTQLLQLPVTLENDANCAALAELKDGAAQDVSNLLFMIIGTGVGGAVITDNHIWHGKHLFGGEFGYMLVDDTHILSDFGSPVKVARHYTKKRHDGHIYDGQTVFALADQGDQLAIQEVDRFYNVLGRAIFNLQYSFDPEKIVIGGGVSNNPQLLPRLNQVVEACRQASKIGTIMPQLVTCAYTANANLRGAAVDFSSSYPDLVDALK